MSTLRFDGRVAVVTGAGQGLGRAYALNLAARHAAVVVNDLGVSLDGAERTDSPAHRVVQEITAAGGRAVCNLGDVSRPEGAQSIVDDALEHFGRIDIVVNNAGIVHRCPFPDVTHEDFQRHLAVHQLGAFNVTRAAWPHLREQGYGRIVMIISTALYGIPEVVAYSSAKGGCMGLAKGLALAGNDHGIKVNMVAPIAFTRMSNRTGVSEAALRERAAALPSDRVAALVAVLAHEDCPSTSQMYFAAGDRVARIFLAESPGYSSADGSPEDLLAHWDLINAPQGFTTPEVLPDSPQVVMCPPAQVAPSITTRTHSDSGRTRS